MNSQKNKNKTTIRVLGIDPGMQFTGYGIIDGSGKDIIHVESGRIKTNSKNKDWDRLKTIYDGLTEIIKKHKPSFVVIEQIFVNKNVNSALKLGYVRGAAMLAASCSGIDVSEYTPLEVKTQVTGYGRADKHQIKNLVEMLLKKKNLTSFDEADALAIAICHYNNLRFNIKV